MVVSSLGDDMEIPIKKRKFNAKIGIGEIAEREGGKRDGDKRDTGGGSKDGRVLLALPQTYMNRSGYSVSSIMGFYRLSPKDIIVVLDDIDLGFGKIRIRPGGGSGGHRGMKSIIDELDTNDFIRVRIGIGRGENGDAANFVLGRFRSEEEAHLDDIIERAKKALLSILHDGVDFAMNRFNE